MFEGNAYVWKEAAEIPQKVAQKHQKQPEKHLQHDPEKAERERACGQHTGWKEAWTYEQRNCFLLFDCCWVLGNKTV